MALVLDGEGSISGFNIISVDSAFDIGTVKIRDSSGAASFKDSDGNSIAIKSSSINTGGITAGSVTATDLSVGNITTTGYVRGPSTFTIDPSEHDSSTGTLRVRGNLTVDGTTTTINSTTVTTADKNIVIAQGAVDSAAADGAGITIDTVNASLTYSHNDSDWKFNRGLEITSGDLHVSELNSQITQGPSLNASVHTGMGIKASTPRFTMEPTGDAQTSRIQFAKTDGTMWGSIFAYNTGEQLQYSAATHKFKTASTERMRIDSSGNVGINNSSPSSYYSTDLVVGAAGEGGITIASTATTVASYLMFADGTTGDERYRGYISYGHNTDLLGLRSASDIQFLTGGSTERMRIDSSGNVGIGTATPAGKLDLNGTLVLSGDTEHLLEKRTTSAITSLTVETTELRGRNVDLMAYDDVNIRAGTGDKITLHAGGTERARIDATGNMGIGGAPTSFGAGVATLQLKGLSGSQATRAGALRFISNDGTSCDTAIYSDNGFMSFYTGTSSAQILSMRIDATGNVGIGVTDPDNLLTVGGTTQPRILLRANGDAGASQLNFGDASDIDVGRLRYDHSNNSMSFFTAATERMRIDASGNVGLAVTPSAWGSGEKAFQILGTTYGGGVFASGNNVGTIVGANAYWDGVGYKRINAVPVSLIQFSGGATYFYRAGTGAANSAVTLNSSMVIDSSGNLLVGKTSASTSTVGGEINSDGTLVGVRASGNPLLLNRTTTDGAIATFRKDNTTVGAIGTSGGDVTIYSTAAGHCGLRFLGDPAIAPVNNSGVLVDNSIDIGESSNRFKDLYLSGGAYLGGTGAANHLDDYEEGTWTPVYSRMSSNPSVTYSSQTGAYTKIGNLVYASFDCNATSISGGSGNARISGLPFTVSNSNSTFAGYSVAQWRDCGAVNAGGSNQEQLKGFAQRNNTYIYIQIDNSGSNGFGTISTTVGYQSSGRITGYIMYVAA